MNERVKCMKQIKNIGAGVGVCIVIAAISTLLAGLQIGSFSLEMIGAPVFAIVIGMLIALCMPSFASGDIMRAGIQFTAKKVLQWAVIILGFSLNLGTIAEVGTKSLPVIVSTIGIALIVAMILMKMLKMNKRVSCLIGVGSSICGGSAIAATAPVIEADDEEVAQSISVIFLFNVLAALIFPSMGYSIGLGSEGFAVFAGTAVNDTSSVTAAASTAEGIYEVDGILSTAVTVKLTRTLAIIPITLILAFWRMYRARKDGSAKNNINFNKIFPWFILFFIVASMITTIFSVMPTSAATVFYNQNFVPAMKWLAKFCIAMAMCAIGLNTNLVRLVKKGGKPILMGFLCWLAVTAMSLSVQYAIGIYNTNL